jgi:PIN domain nuclease of toxin-antitoxin system
MTLLLDTHALIWFLEGSDRLSPTGRAAIDDSRNVRFVSHATAWEMAVKLSLGKLQLQIPFGELFPKVVEANGFIVLLPEFLHYQELLSMPLYHRDPFDRLIIAQARVEKLTVVTSDSHLSVYGIPVLW